MSIILVPGSLRPDYTAHHELVSKSKQASSKLRGRLDINENQWIWNVQGNATSNFQEKRNAAF